MNDLLLLWWLFYVSGALVGAFLGTLLALAIRALFKKIVKWFKED